jgi:hypothetical protein
MRRMFAHQTTLPMVALVLLIMLSAGFSSAVDLTTLRPLGIVEQVPIGKDGKIYLAVGSETVKVPVTGPGKITGYARIPMPTDAPTAISGTLSLSGIPGIPAEFPFEFRSSRRAVWGDDRPGAPSGGKKFSMEIPEGVFTLELVGAVPGGDPMLVILYYDGPAQPNMPGLAPVVLPASNKKAKKKKPLITYRGSAALDVIYNDNILSNSPGYNDDFFAGSYPWKFLTGTTDDLIIAPALDVEARAKFFSLGQSRLRFKVKRWMYARNPIKTNTDFHFYLRQYFGKNQSLELYFHFAPEQYIRQLSDRSPIDDPEDPINWTEFRFQRNVWNATWRQKLSKKLSVKFLYEENYRYYNQPFMENDINAWEVRGNLAWKMSKVLTLNLDYSYEDAQGRALDEPGETPEESDNSDASYARDLYRIGLDIRHKSLKKFVDKIGVSFLYMDYYYTTEKTLVEDPYHAGRRDTFYKGTLELSRKLAKPLNLKLAVRRTERVVDSPWEGDITTDKDFTQWLYWFSLKYSF